MDWSQLLTPLFLTQLLAAGVTLATPLALAALGEVFAERSGSLNLGLEGIMLFSGFIGFNAAYHIGNLWIGILGAVMMGSIMGLLFAFMTVTGLAINFLGNGLAPYFYRLVFKVTLDTPRVEPFQNVPIPVLSDIPFIGDILFNHSVFTYLMFLLVAVTFVIIYKTPFGLRLNAVGESPQTADTLGVNPLHLRSDRRSPGRNGRSLLLSGGAWILLRQYDQWPRLYCLRAGYFRTLGSRMDLWRSIALWTDRRLPEPPSGAWFADSFQLPAGSSLRDDHFGPFDRTDPKAAGSALYSVCPQIGHMKC